MIGVAVGDQEGGGVERSLREAGSARKKGQHGVTVLDAGCSSVIERSTSHSLLLQCKWWASQILLGWWGVAADILVLTDTGLRFTILHTADSTFSVCTVFHFIAAWPCTS